MIYFVMFLLSAGLIQFSENYKKHNKKFEYRCFLVVALALPCILAGMRDYTIGTDVLTYGNGWFERACEYNSIIEYVEKAIAHGLGPGYAVFNFIISQITDNPHMFYFFYELLQILILYFALRPFSNKINIAYAFLFYYFGWYNLSLNMLRQIVAVLFVLRSFEYIYKKKFIPFILYILLATSFHNTAFVTVVLYPIGWAIRSNLRKTYNVLIIISSTLAILLYERIFSLFTKYGFIDFDRYQHYMSESLSGGRYTRLVYFLIILCIAMWTAKRCESSDFNFKPLTLYAVISFVFCILPFIAPSSRIIRIGYYFDVFLVLLVPFAVSVLPIRDRYLKKKGIYAYIMIIQMVYWLITFVIRNGGETVPYIFMTS